MGKDMIVCNSDLIQLIFTQDCKRDPNRQVAGTKQLQRFCAIMNWKKLQFLALTSAWLNSLKTIYAFMYLCRNLHTCIMLKARLNVAYNNLKRS